MPRSPAGSKAAASPKNGTPGEIRLLHTADWHLDRYFPGLGDNAPVRRREVGRTVGRIVDLAIERKVGALLVCGDVFDQPQARSLRWVQGQLSRLADVGIRVLVIPGNHDPLPDCRAWSQGVSWPANVTVLVEEAPVSFPELPDVVFQAAPFRRADAAKSPLRALEAVGACPAGRQTDQDAEAEEAVAAAEAETAGGDAPAFRVALVHGQYRLAENIGENYGPIEPDEVEQSGFHYVALGHSHSFLDCSRGRTKAFYPGSPARLDFGDQAERRVLLVTLARGANGDGVGVKVGVESIPLEDRRFVFIEKTTAAVSTGSDALYRELDELAATSPEAVVRVRLSGVTDGEALSLARDLEERYGGGAFFAFQVEDRTELRPALRPGDQTVLGAFVRRMEQNSAGKLPPDLVKLAYTLGVTALRGGKLG